MAPAMNAKRLPDAFMTVALFGFGAAVVAEAVAEERVELAELELVEEPLVLAELDELEELEEESEELELEPELVAVDVPELLEEVPVIEAVESVAEAEEVPVAPWIPKLGEKL